VLRAIHIFEDNRRVTEQVQALRAGDFERFLQLSKASGRSSWMYLQNVIPAGCTTHQELAVALALAEKLLDGRGAFRVQGGGFAGTIQAFVPLDMLDAFRSGMEAVLGAGSCHVLNIRPEGGILLEVV
jgi:galactokinase